MLILISLIIATFILGSVDGFVFAHGSPLDRLMSVLFGSAAATALVIPFAALFAVWMIGARMPAKIPMLRNVAGRMTASSLLLQSVFKRKQWRIHQLRFTGYSVAFSILTSIFIVAISFRWMNRILSRIEDSAFYHDVTAIAFAILALAAMIVAWILYPLGKRIDIFIRNRPPIFLSIWFAMLAAPIIGVLYSFCIIYGEYLGDKGQSVLLLIVILPLATVTVHGLLRHMRTSRFKLTGAIMTIVWAGLFIAMMIGYKIQSATAMSLEEGILSQPGVALARNLTDVDRDGASSLLGGGDCDEFNSDVSPRTRDIPGNGLDENCDGRDSVSSKENIIPTPQYYEKLRPDQVKKFNIVLVVIEALRADHVGASGYDYETTPNLDRLNDEAIFFAQMYSQSSATAYSLPSMLSGELSGMMSWHLDKIYQMSDKHITLAERLKGYGYESTIIVNNDLNRRFTSLHQGYDSVLNYYDSVSKKDRHYYSRHGAPVITTNAIEFIEDNLRKSDRAPFFLTVHYQDPHAPYEEHSVEGYPSFRTNDKGRYDSEIAYTDRHLGHLIDFLKHREKGLWDDTILIVTGDHGEEFKEHGKKTHAKTCYQESVHVAFWLKAPGLDPQFVNQNTALVDVVPTVLELIGEPDKSGDLDGQSLLVPILSPESVDPLRPIFCTITNYKKTPFHISSVRSGDMTLIKDLYTGNELELYDRSVDPKEQNNLINNQKKFGNMTRRLESWLMTSNRGNLKPVTE